MKTRTRYQAARRQRPEGWADDDCALAHWLANTFARPQGPHGPTPDQAWAARSPITAEERARFRALVAQYAAETWAERGLALHASVSPQVHASIQRVAIRRVRLRRIAHGIPSIWRRPVSLLLTSRFRA